MSDGRAVPLFVNPSAGTGVGVDALRETFGAAVEVEAVEPGRLGDRIRRAIADGHPVIAVAGGDGSLRTAVNALAGTDTALAIVPAGTLNNFARRMGVPDLETAHATLLHGRPVAIPLGSVGDELFLNTITFGEYPRTVRLRERLRRYLGKWPAALVGFLNVLMTLRLIHVELDVDDEKEITRTTPFLWVGIGHGSFPSVAESKERRSSPDLEVAILHARTPIATAAFMWRASLQMIREQYPVRDRALEVFNAGRITLHSKRALDGTSDGELIRVPPPVLIGIRENAVRVMRLPDPADS